MIFSQDRGELRRAYFTAWRKHQLGEPLEPLEQLLAKVVGEHPEYQSVVANPGGSIHRDWLPEMGESNPFLHMGLHIAIQEQLTTDRPDGIRKSYQAILRRCGDAHDAEHRIMECLAESLWQSQRSGQAPDHLAYLACVRRLARK